MENLNWRCDAYYVVMFVGVCECECVSVYLKFKLPTRNFKFNSSDYLFAAQTLHRLINMVMSHFLFYNKYKFDLLVVSLFSLEKKKTMEKKTCVAIMIAETILYGCD